NALTEWPQAGMRFAKSDIRSPYDLEQIAKLVRRCQQLPGQELFQYVGDDGSAHGISSTDVNDYIREAAGAEFTAKDFRTWHGTVQALELTRLACHRSNGDATPRQTYNAKEILAAVAQQLGNTPAVCKKAYVHPAVLSLGGTLASDADTIAEVWDRIAKGKTRRLLHAAEVRLIEFLRDHRRRQKKMRTPKVGSEMQALLQESVAKAKAKTKAKAKAKSTAGPKAKPV
ncbi:MAG: DNA topoisomerase IB, partial [Gammaproteobacteria bacterium]|nr:DNA topoisomerase IB [Gammaproteobacteria bacterium]